jgi:hypothetical protein
MRRKSPTSFKLKPFIFIVDCIFDKREIETDLKFELNKQTHTTFTIQNPQLASLALGYAHNRKHTNKQILSQSKLSLGFPNSKSFIHSSLQTKQTFIHPLLPT